METYMLNENLETRYFILLHVLLTYKYILLQNTCTLGWSFNDMCPHNLHVFISDFHKIETLRIIGEYY